MTYKKFTQFSHFSLNCLKEKMEITDFSWVILIDFDNTLVYTNEANNQAYLDAMRYFFPNKKLQTPVAPRITKEVLLSSDLLIGSSIDVDDVISKKKDVFFKFIELTKVNNYLVDFLDKVRHKNGVYLITKGDKNRVDGILDYHQLQYLFCDKFFIDKTVNKIDYVCDVLPVDLEKLIFFEDDENELIFAKNMGAIDDFLFILS